MIVRQLGSGQEPNDGSAWPRSIDNSQIGNPSKSSDRESGQYLSLQGATRLKDLSRYLTSRSSQTANHFRYSGVPKARCVWCRLPGTVICVVIRAIRGKQITEHPSARHIPCQESSFRPGFASTIRFLSCNLRESGSPARRSRVLGWVLKGGTLNRPRTLLRHLTIRDLHFQGRNVPSRSLACIPAKKSVPDLTFDFQSLTSSPVTLS